MKSIYTIFLISVVLFSSCTKDEILFIPDQEQEISQSYLHNLLSVSQSNILVTIEDNKGSFVNNNGDFLVHIPANSLQDEQNRPFVGQIKLQFAKLGNDKSDFIVTPSQLFEGQTRQSDTYTFKITSKENGDLIKVTKPIELYLAIQGPTNNTLDLNLYEINANNMWEVIEKDLNVQSFEVSYDETTYKIEGVKTTISTAEQTFSFAPKSITTGNQSILSLQMDSKFNATNTLAYFRSNDGSAVIQLKSIYKGSFISPTFTDTQNLEGQIITISDIGNKNYYFGSVPVSVSTGNTEVKIDMQSLTIQEIKAAIQAL